MKIPDHLMSEANIQAEFYCLCREFGLNCTLELMTPYGRVDVAIFSDDWERLLAVVECKFNKHGKVNRTGQIERYKQLGVPVYGLARMNSLSLVSTIRNACYNGVCWAQIEAIERRPYRRHRVRASNGTLVTPIRLDELDEHLIIRK